MAEEYCWAIKQAVGGYDAADQVPEYWSLGFNWIPLYITYIADDMYTKYRLGQNSTRT